MNALTAGPGVACGEVSLATAGITATTRVAATTKYRPAPARRTTRQAVAVCALAGAVLRCPATEPARHPMQPASNTGRLEFSMMRHQASTGAIMAARMGQSAQNPLPLFRTARNWHTAKYRATATPPARTAWIEVFPRTSKGSAPMINTKSEQNPATTESTIFPIRPEITSRPLRKSFRNPFKFPTESPVGQDCILRAGFQPALVGLFTSDSGLNFQWLPGAIVTEYVSTSARTLKRPPDDWMFGGDRQHYFGG